jgi:hypothetical protein
MARKLSKKTALILSLLFSIGIGQPSPVIESSFSLALTGSYGSGTEYRYLLNRAGDSGVISVQGLERPLGWADFRKVKSAIVNYAMDLTEADYGAAHDSADFKGELSINALDRNHIIRLNAALTLGTLPDGSMAGLLRFLMKQVEDSLRLPKVSTAEPVKKRKKE